MELSGLQLKMSSSNHPQTDGASEIMNRMVKNYLCCYCSYHQDDWDMLLHAAEFAYNSLVSGDLQTSPCEIEEGRNPKSAVYFIHSREDSIESINEIKKELRNSVHDV